MTPNVSMWIIHLCHHWRTRYVVYSHCVTKSVAYPVRYMVNHWWLVNYERCLSFQLRKWLYSRNAEMLGRCDVALCIVCCCVACRHRVCQQAATSTVWRATKQLQPQLLSTPAAAGTSPIPDVLPGYVAHSLVTTCQWCIAFRAARHGNWNFLTRELLFPVFGTFIYWNFCPLELSFPGTFVLDIKISMELLFPNIDH